MKAGKVRLCQHDHRAGNLRGFDNPVLSPRADEQETNRSGKTDAKFFADPLVRAITVKP